MRIKSLELNNWGPHEHIKWNMDAPVVGLLGPNGSGKTNILSAIDFAFTGLLDLTQEKYVRSTNGEPAANASVDITFTKGGIEGRIFRQIGKTPKRQLWWGGVDKPVTKASEVEGLLAEILDCDRKAISLAVFLSQGHVGDFLFQTEANRESDFARMCLIDHLEQIPAVASEEILKLSKTITDLNPMRDEAVRSRQEQEAALRTAEAELAQLPDVNPALQWVRRVKEQMRIKEQAELEMSGCNGSIVELNRKIAESKIEKPYLQSLVDSSAAQQVVDDLRVTLKHMQQLKQKAAAASSELEKRAMLEADYENLKKQMAGCDEGVLFARNNEITARLEELQKAIDRENESNVARQLRSSKAKALAEAEALLAIQLTAVQTLPPESRHEEIRNTIIGLVEATRLTPLVIQLAEQAGDQHCCPLCQGKDLSELPKGPALAQLKERHELQLQQIAEHETFLQKLIRERNAAEAAYKSQKDLVARLAGELAALPEVPETGIQIGDYTAQADTLRAELAANKASLNEQQRRLNEATFKLAELEKLMPRDAAQQAVDAAVGLREDEVESEIRMVDTYLRVTSALRNELAVKQSRHAELATIIAAANQEINSSIKHTPPGVSGPVTTAHAIITLENDLGIQQANRARCEGVVSMAAESFKRSERRVLEVEQRMEDQQRVRGVIDDLEQLKNAFGRTGVPRHYLSRVFDLLVEGTQDNLADWEEDFQVERDPENLFNFLFYRTADPETVLDQSQLSGGQKIRLALSFVQAVQQLIFPGLNFLCVDEPSTHLDNEGKEGLVRLFRNIAHSTADGDSQVLVVDHAPELQSGFSICHTLKKRGE